MWHIQSYRLLTISLSGFELLWHNLSTHWWGHFLLSQVHLTQCFFLKSAIDGNLITIFVPLPVDYQKSPPFIPLSLRGGSIDRCVCTA